MCKTFWTERGCTFLFTGLNGLHLKTITVNPGSGGWKAKKQQQKNPKNMQHNMTRDKQRCHRKCLCHLWFHHRTTMLCDSTLTQSETRRQATTKASLHETEGSLPKIVLCKQKAEQCLCLCMFFFLCCVVLIFIVPQYSLTQRKHWSAATLKPQRGEVNDTSVG